jgi:hypothetical protein
MAAMSRQWKATNAEDARGLTRELNAFERDGWQIVGVLADWAQGRMNCDQECVPDWYTVLAYKDDGLE